MPEKLVSICIPAYENVVLLKRLLDSIAIQNYPAIEVIISDDSAGEDIKNALSAYAGKLQLKYFKNSPPLKSPGNWNNAMDKASGDLLMLIHHDDWLSDENVIRQYVAAFDNSTSVDFVFCRSMAFTENDAAGLNEFHKSILNKIALQPEVLLLGNIIGPPGNVMVRKNINIRYTAPFIWLVDVEYYMQLLMAKHKFYFINEALVSVGLHEEQATKYVEQNKEIKLKEHLLLAQIHGDKIFSEWRIYDLYWRLLRNYNIKTKTDLAALDIDCDKLPVTIIRMLKTRESLPAFFLQTGVFSKLFMWLNYLRKR